MDMEEPKFNKRLYYFEPMRLEDGTVENGLCKIHITDRSLYYWVGVGEDEDFADFVDQGEPTFFLVTDAEVKRYEEDDEDYYAVLITAYKDLDKKETERFYIPMPATGGKKKAETIREVVLELVRHWNEDEEKKKYLAQMATHRKFFYAVHLRSPEEVVKGVGDHNRFWFFYEGRRNLGAVLGEELKDFVWERGDYFAASYVRGSVMEPHMIPELSRDMHYLIDDVYALGFKNQAEYLAFFSQVAKAMPSFAQFIPSQLKALNPNHPLIIVMGMPGELSKEPLFLIPANGISYFKRCVEAFAPFSYEKFVERGGLKDKKPNGLFFGHDVGALLELFS